MNKAREFLKEGSEKYRLDNMPNALLNALLNTDVIRKLSETESSDVVDGSTPQLMDMQRKLQELQDEIAMLRNAVHLNENRNSSARLPMYVYNSSVNRLVRDSPLLVSSLEAEIARTEAWQRYVDFNPFIILLYFVLSLY